MTKTQETYGGSKMDISYEQWEITPAMAKDILANMATNRNYRPSRGTTYASDMEKGRWGLSPQPICFNKEGQLIDGQHRLEAVIKSGATITFNVALNVPNDIPIDTNLTRTTADSLRCRGIISDKMATKTAVALTNAFIIVKLKFGAKTSQYTNEDKATFLNKYEDKIYLSLQISGKGSCRALLHKSGCQCALFSALANGVDPESLFEFARVVNTGFIDDNSKKTQKSAITLRNTILSFPTTYSTPMRGASGVIAMDSITEQAIRDYTEGVPRTKKYNLFDKFPYSCNISLTEAFGWEDKKNVPEK